MMKSIFLAFFSILLFASCSNDSDNQTESFFNLHEGNLWVYKRYFSNDNVNFTYSNEIDSVRVVGDTLINSNVYSRLIHKKYYSGNFYAQEKEYLRVDTNGHLVNSNGLVLHSGTDNLYQHVRDFLVGGIVNVGSISEHLLEPYTTNIEGTDYFVYSYYGNFTPIDSSIPNNYIFYQYKEGLGLVCQHCAAVSGYSSYEDRLVYYELN